MIEFAPEETAAITAVVREADQAFESSGGSSRHWVRDQFLPRLATAGWRLVKVVPIALPVAVKPYTLEEWNREETEADGSPLPRGYGSQHPANRYDEEDPRLRATVERLADLEAEVRRLQARDSEMAMQSRRDANRADANAAECGRLNALLGARQ